MDYLSSQIVELEKRIKSSFENGYRTIVLRGFNKKILRNLLERKIDAMYFKEDLLTDINWYSELNNLSKVSQLAQLSENNNERILITEWLYAFIMKKFQLLSNNLGKTVVISNNASNRKIKLSDKEKKIIFEKLNDLYSNNEGVLALINEEIDFDNTVQLFDDPEIQQINNIQQLRNVIKKNKSIYGINLEKELRESIQEDSIFCKNPLEADTVLLSKNTQNAKVQIRELNAYLKNNGKNPVFIRFDGYIPSEKIRNIDLNNYLQKFGHKSFRKYNALTRAGETYSITQKELIQYLIDQHFTKNPRDLFFVASTGSGKSLIYNIASSAISDIDNSLTIVISPLKALMEDQTDNLKRRHSIWNTEYINSSLNYDEKEAILKLIEEGKISTLFVSPETFVLNSLERLTSGRELGLLVVDEAHLVSTWGKTFRVDYGYLGDELKYFRKKHKFPIFATTATAVWDGPLDTINEISQLLNLNLPKIVFTDIRRNNITIKIERFAEDKKSKKSVTQQKIEHTATKINHLLNNYHKSLVYCPYVSHVDKIKAIVEANSSISDYVRTYTGPTNDNERKATHKLFRNGRVKNVIATKAFGMGIDIKDIDAVYHHCVPASLSDYTQEIGRVGRNGKEAYALTDYYKSDPVNSLKLAKFSVPQIWKLSHIMDHLKMKFRLSKQNEIAISLDDIKFLLTTGQNDDPDRLRERARTSIFLIQKDLEFKYGRPILVRKSESYRYLYFSATENEGESLVEKFPEITKYCESTKRNSRYRKNESIHDIGPIYSVDITRLWERLFKKETLKTIVWKFFNRPSELFKEKIYPRYEADIILLKEKETVKRIFSELLECAEEVSEKIKKEVDLDSFTKIIQTQVVNFPNLININNAKEKVRSVFLNYFVSPNRSKMKKGADSEYYFYIRGDILNTKYSGRRYKHSYVKSTWLNELDSVLSLGEISFSKFFPPSNSKFTQIVLSIMDIFRLADINYSGGESCVIQLKCTNRNLLLNLRNDYKCKLVTELRKRIDKEYNIAKNFYEKDISNEERWEYIKDYFLGKIEI